MDDVHSSFSSHASTAFAAVAAAGTIASRRHSRDAVWIWGAVSPEGGGFELFEARSGETIDLPSIAARLDVNAVYANPLGTVAV